MADDVKATVLPLHNVQKARRLAVAAQDDYPSVNLTIRHALAACINALDGVICFAERTQQSKDSPPQSPLDDATLREVVAAAWVKFISEWRRTTPEYVAEDVAEFFVRKHRTVARQIAVQALHPITVNDEAFHPGHPWRVITEIYGPDGKRLEGWENCRYCVDEDEATRFIASIGDESAHDQPQSVEIGPDGKAYIVGIPGVEHNCDAMGCPSAGAHTLKIVPIDKWAGQDV